MDKEAAITITKRYTEAIRAIVNPTSVFLYGSYAKGTASADSDIDIAVFVNEDVDYFPMVKSLWKISNTIDNRIEPVLFTRSDDSALKYAVEHTGICVHG